MITSVTVKTLRGGQLDVPLEPLDTIAAVKARIFSITGDPFSRQKIFFGGKNMSDDSVLEQCGFKESDFLVVMVSNLDVPGPARSSSPVLTASSAPTPPSTPSTSKSTTEVSTPHDSAISTPSSTDLALPVSAPAPLKSEIQPPTEFKATSTSKAPAPEQPSAGPSLAGVQTALATGPPSNNVIVMQMEMGSSEDNISPALRTADNNPSRAAASLTSDEIPEDPKAQSPIPGLEQAVAANQASPTESATPSIPSGPQLPATQAGDPMQIVSEHVTAGSGLGQQGERGGPGRLGGRGGRDGQDRPGGRVGSTRQGSSSNSSYRPYPAPNSSSSSNSNRNRSSNSNSNSLFGMFRQMTREHPGLLQPLTDRLRTSSPSFAGAFPDAFVMMAEGLHDGEDGGNIGSFGRTGASASNETIEITPEEQDALDRIQEMGFARNKAIEAYFGCDKNEELTINYLLEHGDDN